MISVKTCLLAALAIVPCLSAWAAEPVNTSPTSVVIVHGAFADGSDWTKVIRLLQAKGVRVVAVQNPLTSLEDDVAATKRAIDSQTGKVVLVGHSWGGTVITEAGVNAKVASLVYVAAFAPDAGQTTGELGKSYPPVSGLAHLVADSAGFLTLTSEGVMKHFAQDVASETTAVMVATQGPIQSKVFQQKVVNAAWKTKPSWFVVSEEDRMIQPDLQRDMAKKIGARITSLRASHVPQQSQPEKIAEVILSAVGQVK
jgi:pimeloyl-ACP methyl ester carboxylesterase